MKGLFFESMASTRGACPIAAWQLYMYVYTYTYVCTYVWGQYSRNNPTGVFYRLWSLPMNIKAVINLDLRVNTVSGNRLRSWSINSCCRRLRREVQTSRGSFAVYRFRCCGDSSNIDVDWIDRVSSWLKNLYRLEYSSLKRRGANESWIYRVYRLRSIEELMIGIFVA